jgi:hypothetical protein
VSQPVEQQAEQQLVIQPVEQEEAGVHSGIEAQPASDQLVDIEVPTPSN